jgi:hypothetical protein
LKLQEEREVASECLRQGSHDERPALFDRQQMKKNASDRSRAVNLFPFGAVTGSLSSPAYTVSKAATTPMSRSGHITSRRHS